LLNTKSVLAVGDSKYVPNALKIPNHTKGRSIAVSAGLGHSAILTDD